MSRLEHPLQDAPAGDPARQAIASLRGYVYQIAASALAWLHLDENGRIYLEVAEDYAVLAAGALQAIQLKDTAASGATTLNTKSVRNAVASYVDLVERNPHRSVQLHYLTTSPIGKERGHNALLYEEAGLTYWRKAAIAADVRPLRVVLEGEGFSESVRAFVRARDDDRLRRELLCKVHWNCGQPDLPALQRELQERLIVLARHHDGLPSLEARRLTDVVMHHVLKKTVLDDAARRVLTLGELYELIDEATMVSMPRAAAEALREKADARNDPKWQLIEFLIERVLRADSSRAVVVDRSPNNLSSSSAEERFTRDIEQHFTTLARNIRELKDEGSQIDGQALNSALEGPQATALFGFLSQLPKGDFEKAARLLWELCNRVSSPADATPSVGIGGSPREAKAHVSTDDLLRQMRAASSIMEQSQRQLRDLHVRWVESLDEKLNTDSVNEVLRIASALEVELRLASQFGERRALCLDADIIMCSASIATAREKHEPDAAIAFYFLNEQSPIPLKIAPEHANELSSIAAALMRRVNQVNFEPAADSAHELRRLRHLLAGKGIQPLPARPESKEEVMLFQQLRQRIFKLLQSDSFFRGWHAERMSRSSWRDADSLARIVRMNDAEPADETFWTLVSTTKRVLSLPDRMNRVFEARYSTPFVQHVYGPAWTCFARSTGAHRDKRYLEATASAILQARNDISRILQRRDDRDVKVDRALLPYLQQSLKTFGEFLEPFHERVARAVEEERQRQMEEFERWIVELKAGHKIFDNVILETIIWLDDIASGRLNLT